MHASQQLPSRGPEAAVRPCRGPGILGGIQVETSSAHSPLDIRVKAGTSFYSPGLYLSALCTHRGA